MKKNRMIVMLLGLALALGLVLAGCGPTAKLPGLERLQQQYGEIANAQTINQTITVTRGSLKQFESNKRYQKTGSGYSVKGTEKRLNDTSMDAPYTTETVSETVTSVASATPTLELNDQYFEAGFKLTDTELTAVVKPQNIGDVLGLAGDLAAPTDDLQLSLSVGGGHVTGVKINYLSGDSAVEIVLTIYYN